VALNGKGVVVTRPAALARGLATLIEAAGGTAWLFPAIEIEPLAAKVPPGRFDMTVFISPTAVRQGLKYLDRTGKVVALSGGTRRELQRSGVGNVIAAEGADSEALLAMPELREVAGLRIAIFRGEGGREVLADTLRKRGASVDYVECYRRVRPRTDPAPLLAAWRAGQLHAVTVSSAEGLANLFSMLDPALLHSLPLFVPHARVAQEARRLGAREAALAGPGDHEMLAALVAYFKVP
jgi:uroporphyrinogen-III synthase